MRSRTGSRYALRFALASMICALAAAGSASAAVLVGLQQRLFERYGDGGFSIDAVPCCQATPMNPVPTVDARTVARNMGAYFAEFKNKTAMVGNLLGLGTPAALSGDGPRWYGFYDPAGGVTIQNGRYTTHHTQMLLFPGGNLRRLSNFLDRSVQDQVFGPNSGPGNFSYAAIGNTPGRPTFRSPTGWTPFPAMAGQLHVTAGPNRFGGTRSIIHQEWSIGVDEESFGIGYRFRIPSGEGPGAFFTTRNVVRRATASATFAYVTIPSPMATTGMVLFEGLGTVWVTTLPYTTGRVQVLNPTAYSLSAEYTCRTETGFNHLQVTNMGGVTGQLQLVSGHLLQARSSFSANLAGTNMTRITFTPEPESAVLLGAGALVLIGAIRRDIGRHRVLFARTRARHRR